MDRLYRAPLTSYPVLTQEKLTPVSFDRLLSHLHPNRELAGKKYEDLRQKLIKFFEWNSCSGAEDLADETLDRIAQRLDKQDVRELMSFTFGVARNVRQEARRRAAKQVSLPESPTSRWFQDRKSDPDVVHEGLHSQWQVARIQDCLQLLPECDRELFLTYHGRQAKDRNTLAREYGVSIGALRVRINRIRAKLEASVLNGVRP